MRDLTDDGFQLIPTTIRIPASVPTYNFPAQAFRNPPTSTRRATAIADDDIHLRCEQRQRIVEATLADFDLGPWTAAGVLLFFRCSMKMMLALPCTYRRVASAPRTGSNPGWTSCSSNIAAAEVDVGAHRQGRHRCGDRLRSARCRREVPPDTSKPRGRSAGLPRGGCRHRSRRCTRAVQMAHTTLADGNALRLWLRDPDSPDGPVTL